MNQDDSQTKKIKVIFTVLKFVVLLGIVIALPLYIFVCKHDVIASFQRYDEVIQYLRSFGWRSFFYYLLLEVAQIVICVLPGEIVQFAAGSIFGFLPGLILTLIGCAVGQTIAYYLAHFLGEDGLKLILGDARMEEYVKRFNSERTYLLTFLLYLIPGIPKDLLCYAAGLSNMKLRAFLFLSLVGRIPGLCGCLLFGDMMMEGNYKGMIVLGIICAIVLLLCFLNRRKVNQWIDKIYSKIS